MAGRVTQETIETMRDGQPNARLTQQTLETMRDGQPLARVTQISIEIMRPSVQTFNLDATDTVVFESAPEVGFAVSAESTVVFGNFSEVGKAVSAESTIEFSDGNGLAYSVDAVDTIVFVGQARTNKIPVSATDTISFAATVNRAQSRSVSAVSSFSLGGPSDSHNTNIVVNATDTIQFSVTDLPGGEWVKLITESLTFIDYAVVVSSAKNVAAIDSIVFSDFEGNAAIVPVNAADTLVFVDTGVMGGVIQVSVTETIILSSSDPAYLRAENQATFSSVASAFQGNQDDEDEVRLSDIADGTIILPNPELGMSVVLRSKVDPHFPFSYINTPTGIIMIANGVDPMFRWRPDDKRVDTAGVIAPTTSGTITATEFTNTDAEGNVIPSPPYAHYVRFIDKDGNFSDLSPISTLSRGEAPFTYTDIPVSTQIKVKRRQILRNLAGGSNTYYVDIDTDDLYSTTFTSELTDEELILKTPVPIVANDGSPLANVYGVPPSHKSCLAYHLGRVFAAVDIEYKIGNAIVEAGSTTVQGVGTNWVESMAGRAFWVVGAKDFYTIESVNEEDQQFTLTAAWEGLTDQYAQYTVRAQPEERRLIYYTESGIPEGWPATYALELAEDGDEITGILSFNSFLYIVEKRNTYKFTFRNDPAIDGTIFAATNRGSINQRCMVLVSEFCYMLDEQGIHRFNGQTSEPVSQVIQDFFQGTTGGISINWDADQNLWHAAWDSSRNIIRWFVSFGSDAEPRHALCYEYILQRWWIEVYERPISASANGTMPNQRSFVGSSGRAVLVLSEGTLDGVNETADTRGKISNPQPLSFYADAPNALAEDLVGFPVSVASGRGAGQVRTVVAVSGKTAYIDLPWMITPGEDSVYQFGGFAWEWKTGWFRFNADEQENPRDIEMIYSPTKNDASFDISLYYNHQEIPRDFVKSSSDNGVTIRSGSPDATVEMKGYDGHANIQFSGHRETRIRGDRFLAIAFKGSGSIDPVRIYSVSIKGVEE